MGTKNLIRFRRHFHFGVRLLLLAATGVLTGCGTTLSRDATQQLLISDAVDRSIRRIDFTVLSGQKVYFDTQYIQHIKGQGFVNAEYIISSLRQQMVAAGLLLQDKAEDADYVVEARVGALGHNNHEITYGLPANSSLGQALNTAATMMPGVPALPALPDVSVAKKNDELGACKVAAFAYDRRTKERLWQSGLSQATSDAKDTWFLGAGPFQSGTVYDGPQFAGDRIRFPFFWRKSELTGIAKAIPYEKEIRFGSPQSRLAEHADDAKAGKTASEDSKEKETERK